MVSGHKGQKIHSPDCPLEHQQLESKDHCFQAQWLRYHVKEEVARQYSLRLDSNLGMRNDWLETVDNKYCTVEVTDSLLGLEAVEELY